MQRLVLLAALLPCAACGDQPVADADAPIALDGPWTVSRAAQSQPPGCREIHPGDLIVIFHPGGQPAIELRNGSLEPQDLTVTADSATFVSEDYPFPADPLRPALISHQLHWVNDELVGTASAQGDGDDLGCRWDLFVQGIHIYDL